MESELKHARRQRYQQIVDVLVRHGLGYLTGILGLERFVPFYRGLLGHPRRPEPYTRPEHVRMALEELGTCWIKLGQILSTRPDLLPPRLPGGTGEAPGRGTASAGRRGPRGADRGTGRPNRGLLRRV